jgi:hypothetical protein
MKDGSFQGHSITFVRREKAELQRKTVLSWGLLSLYPPTALSNDVTYIFATCLWN